MYGIAPNYYIYVILRISFMCTKSVKESRVSLLILFKHSYIKKGPLVKCKKNKLSYRINKYKNK